MYRYHQLVGLRIVGCKTDKNKEIGIYTSYRHRHYDSTIDAYMKERLNKSHSTVLFYTYNMIQKT